MNKKQNTNARLHSENLRSYTMRLHAADMNALRERAAREGWRGYNAVVRALIHAYVTGEIDASLLPY